MTTQSTTFTTIFGTAADDVVTANGHTWTASSTTGLYTTGSDLGSEWASLHDDLMNGVSLNFIQRLEANAQAVFQNTALSSLTAGQKALDRMDVQRQLDAMEQAMVNAGISLTGPINEQQYLTIEQTLQSSPSLEELAMQGHGLNNSSDGRYSGYINDFQHADSHTLYVGGGLDNNENALSSFMGDVILSDAPFPTVAQNGVLQQLDPNGNAAQTLADADGAWNYAGTSMVLTASSFATTAGTASSTPYAPPASDTSPAPKGEMYSLTGFLVPTTITVNGDTWKANSAGLYVTSTDLEAEWQSAYQTMQAGKGSTLSAAQFLEGNAEAVFLNTGLAKLGQYDATQIHYDRMDVQREIDAVVGALQAAGLDPNQPLTTTTWLELEHSLQDNPALEELAVQGHGLNSPPALKYNGYTNDFQNNVDQQTLYVGPGDDSGERAIADLFDDADMTHAPFPTIVQNGQVIQLNQNGDTESTVQVQVDQYNQLRFDEVLTAADFNVPGNPAGKQAPGTATTDFGGSVPTTITVNGDVWKIGSDGRYHTSTDLMTQWQKYYAEMLAGAGASLTPIERMEGNAEAVFENTGLSNLNVYGFADQQSFREDAQREFDAIGAAMTELGLGANELSAADYLAIGQAIQSNPVWEELAVQGHGLNSPPSVKYYGYTNDFQNNSDNSTYFVGGGADSGERAIQDFFDDVEMTHLLFPVVYENGALWQLNQNGDQEDTLATVVAETNESMFTRVFVASDFSTNASAVGAMDYVTYKTPLQTDPTPTAGTGQMLSLYGQPVATTLTVNGDTWVANANGLYQTSTDLTLQWYNSYQAALAGKTLTLTQKWEAQAEAVFLNTGMANLSEGQQAIDRMDVQREIDAVVAVVNQLGLGGAPLTDANYLAISRALQDNPALEQLAIEGFGLNNQSGGTEYAGYNNDFRWSVDNSTLYVGAGPDNGERTLGDFFGDEVITYLAFPVILQNGEVTQLDQNGNGQSTLNEAVEGINNTLFGAVFTAANFEIPGATPLTATPGPTTITGYGGETLPATFTINGHTWVADSTGTYQTTANLEIEWRTYYQEMLAGKGNQLTATQRLEGNMEAFLENSNINYGWDDAAREERVRSDIQRYIDAMAGAMQIDETTYGINPNDDFTEASYMQLSNTIQGDPQLEELALQGLGVTSPSSPQYNGAYNALFASGDGSTYFNGGGPGDDEIAIQQVMESMLGDLAYETVYVNGAWMTTDGKGAVGNSALIEAQMLNQAMYSQVFVSGDFSKSATAIGPVVLIPGAQSTTPAPISSVTPEGNDIVSLSGAQLPSTVTLNGHVWTANGAGLYATTSLAAEWQSDYKIMQAGNGASLNAIQRDEANAQAVLIATGVTKLSAALQQEIREDVQRQLDAEYQAMQIDATSYGISASAALTTTSYLDMAQTIQSDDVLEELALQGHGVLGVTGAEKARYTGVIGDAAGLSNVDYDGGGINNWSKALGTFLQENILGDAPFADVDQWGNLEQLDQTGDVAISVANQVAALDISMSDELLTSKSFN